MIKKTLVWMLVAMILIVPVLAYEEQLNSSVFDTGDAQVWEIQPNNNYGSFTPSYLSESNTGGSRDIYIGIAYNATGKNVSEALLGLFVDTSYLGGVENVTVIKCNDTFNENNITWNNRLTEVTNCDTNLTIIPSFTEGEYVWMDLNNSIEKNTFNNFTILLQTRRVGGTYSRLDMKETTNLSRLPLLNITYVLYNEINNYDFYPNQTTSGENVTFNATLIGDTDSVWVRIWQGITTIATKALSFISGDLWSGQIETNDSFIGISNVTFYTNTTDGTEINITSAEQLNVTLGNLPPVIVINSPINNQKINTKNYVLDVNFTVTDDKDDIANCSLIVNDKINVTNSSISISGTYTISTTLSGGKWEIKINCTDNEGATGDPPINITIPYEKTRTFIIDMNGINYTNLIITMDGMQFNSSYPSNISVDLGSDLIQEWNYTGSLSGNTIATIPKTIIDNWILNNCTKLPIPIYHDYCPIELLFKSDTQGSLNITNVSTLYEENSTFWPGGIDINTWLSYFNNTWLNNISLTAVLNESEINDWLQNNCSGETDDFETEVSSFLSGILLLDNLQFTYVSNITPIQITNASVIPNTVFPNQNVTINATVNISGAIYEVYAIQQELYNGGFQYNDNVPGQNFTIPNGWIARIDVFDVGGTLGNLTLSVYEGGPSGTLKDSRTVTNYTDGWVIFDFGNDPIKVSAGIEYFFNVSSDVGSWNNLGYSNISTYANGTMFINGTPVADQDLMFRVLVYDYWTDSVWLRIWTGITTWLTKALTYIGGNLWSTEVTANVSWGPEVNVTIYANTTDGANATPYDLNFTIINATFPYYLNVNVTPPSPQNYTPDETYSFSIECYSPYGIQYATITHNFTGTLQTYTVPYAGSGNIYTYGYVGIEVGTWNWYMTCVDLYNLTNTTSTFNYTVNTGTPNLEIIILPSDTPSYIDLVNISCISNDVETPRNLFIDGNPATNPTIANFAIGTYLIECNQSSSANWYSGYVNASMLVINQPPRVNLTSPVNGYTFSGSTTEVLLEFNVTDYDSTNLGVVVTLNNVSYPKFYTNNTENGFLVNVTANTTYNWFVTVNDEVSTIQSSVWNFTVGPTAIDVPPTVNLIYPGNGDDLANTFTFINYTFQLNDTDSANLDYTLYVDDFTRCSDSVISNAIYDCNVGPFIPNSSHCWYVNVTDYFTMVKSSTWCFSINATCTPNWIPTYTNCLITDENIKYYVDANNCNNLSGLPVDNGTATTCDYCTPSFYCSAYHSCTSDSIQTCAVVSDYNNCYAQTGLPSDAYSGNINDFTQGCTYNSVLVQIPAEAGAMIAIFLQWITSPLGLLLLAIVCLAIMLAIGLIIASYIRNTRLGE